jgi:hypothetical protein
MSKIGKSEIKASMYALASNNFITEHGREDTDNAPSQNAADNDHNGPKKHVRGNYHGIKKAITLDAAASKIATELGQRLLQIWVPTLLA